MEPLTYQFVDVNTTTVVQGWGIANQNFSALTRSINQIVTGNTFSFLSAQTMSGDTIKSTLVSATTANIDNITANSLNVLSSGLTVSGLPFQQFVNEYVNVRLQQGVNTETLSTIDLIISGKTFQAYINDNLREIVSGNTSINSLSAGTIIISGQTLPNIISAITSGLTQNLKTRNFEFIFDTNSKTKKNKIGVEELTINSIKAIPVSQSTSLTKAFQEEVSFTLLKNNSQIATGQTSGNSVIEINLSSSTVANDILTVSLNRFPQQFNRGLPKGTEITCMTNSGNTVFIGTDGKGIFRSTNQGITWVSLPSSPAFVEYSFIKYIGSTLYAGTVQNGIYVSINNGDSWSVYSSQFNNTYVTDIIVNGSTRYVSTNGLGVFISTDSGVSFNSYNTDLTNLQISSLYLDTGTLLAGSFNGGIFRNQGSGWVSIKNGMGDQNISKIIADATYFYAISFGGGFFRILRAEIGSLPGTLIWQARNADLPSLFLTDLINVSGNLYISTYGAGVIISPDNGISFSSISNGMENENIKSLIRTTNNLLAASNINGVYVSENNGNIWNEEIELHVQLIATKN